MILFTFLALLAVTLADPPKTQYVRDVNCDSIGIKFDFSEDSDLYKETGLNIDLYTGTPPVKVAGYIAPSDNVAIDYADYKIDATTVFGPAARPLLYNIEQPFYAYPLPGFGIKRNYTFGVYCTIVAYDNVNVTTNTTDNGHGNHGGDVITPEDHVENKLIGTQPDGSSVIGDALQYVLDLKDNTYAALVPVDCKYYNPQDTSNTQSVPFVSDKCPRKFPDDPDGYFGTIKQASTTRYELNFKAFTFETVPNSYLAIECDVQLCITSDVADCNPTCWGTATTQAPATSIGTTTTAAPPPVTTTEPEVPTTTTTTAEPTTTPPLPRRRRMVFRYDPMAAASNLVGDGATPQPTTITDKKLMKVTIPGVDGKSKSGCFAEPGLSSPTSICTDSSLLSALYAVIGVLAILVAMLVIALSYIACARRQGAKSPQIYDGPFVPSVTRFEK